MDAGTIRLLEFLNKTKSIYRIPVYQRKYEWTEDQVDQYFYDIERIISDEGYDGHFLGTIVFVKTSFPGMGTDYIIIDGQQRITTSFLLLKAIYDFLEADDSLREEIEDTYFINKHVEPEYERKLIPVENDRQAYEELFILGPSNKPSKIHTNYNRLVYLIRHSKATPKEIYEALMNVKIVYIELEQGRKDENPQIIFESLNSTGLSLTESDLIRNYLLMNELPENQERLYNNYWLRLEERLTNANISNYIRDYLTMKTGRISNKNRVYQSFKQYMNNNSITSEKILKDLYKYSRFYQMFLHQNAENRQIEEYLQVISQMRSTVTYPYLLRIFDKRYNENSISDKEFISILKLIVSYIVRRLIVNFPTNALNKVFAAIGQEIDKHQNNQDDNTSEEKLAINFLMSRRGSAVFPRNEKLKDSFINDDLYNRNHKLAHLILEKIEAHSHKEIVQLMESSIEHIMPQTLTPAWRLELGTNANSDHLLYKDTIGNLTLTNYNSELSNKSFADKKELYKESNIKLTRDIFNINTWNKEAILNRSLELYKKAKVIWQLPEDRYADHHSNELDGTTYYNVFESLKVTGTKPKVLKINEKAYNVSNWKQTLITYLKHLAHYDLEQYLELPKQRKFQRLLTYDSSVFRDPEEVLGIYLEVNMNAQMIYDYLGLLAEHYNMEDEVSILIIK